MTDEKPLFSLLDPPHGEGPHQGMAAVGMAHDMLANHDWQEFLDAVARFDSVGNIFDPTAWMRAQANPNWAAQKRLARAARDFVAEVGAVKAEFSEPTEP